MLFVKIENKNNNASIKFTRLYGCFHFGGKDEYCRNYGICHHERHVGMFAQYIMAAWDYIHSCARYSRSACRGFSGGNCDLCVDGHEGCVAACNYV